MMIAATPLLTLDFDTTPHAPMRCLTLFDDTMLLRATQRDDTLMPFSSPLFRHCRHAPAPMPFHTFTDASAIRVTICYAIAATPDAATLALMPPLRRCRHDYAAATAAAIIRRYYFELLRAMLASWHIACH